ncbi:LacI family DNA-binding transcriptional regulator [Pseudaestuariivita atlantica]|uniref:HTH lacI-type domain-containing protein n=1 Tax=Pseudaestuariivita atlantica TaxID=1317121 RepID=A0A0L1JT65_9RHOB|nr:LacI family DNA-binding transcriptional regulator [Pseudaestuariivita atlantica]KNG94941.1 hypothetical protein ATO11_06135 [Pseudaestuariivita atlantica]
MTRKVGTIRDVADRVGLSIATVSRVMNGARNVAPATRDKVLEAIRALNYLPNPAARALSTAKSRTVATVIPSIEHSIYAKFMGAVERTLAEQGYSLVFAVSNGVAEQEHAAVQKLLGMGAEGFILSGQAHGAELTELLDLRRVPYVFTSVYDPDSAVPTIGYDNHALAAEAVRFLRGEGHERIAVLHGPLDTNDRARARLAGARSAAPVAAFEGALDVAGGKQAARAALAEANRPTALLCFSDVLALGACFALAEAGLSVPGEMSVMGFDNLDWTSELVPPLTTMNLPARKMGQEAARQLVERLETGVPLASARFDGTIITRGSVAPPR